MHESILCTHNNRVQLNARSSYFVRFKNIRQALLFVIGKTVSYFDLGVHYLKTVYLNSVILQNFGEHFF